MYVTTSPFASVLSKFSFTTYPLLSAFNVAVTSFSGSPLSFDIVTVISFGNLDLSPPVYNYIFCY